MKQFPLVRRALVGDKKRNQSPAMGDINDAQRHHERDVIGNHARAALPLILKPSSSPMRRWTSRTLRSILRSVSFNAKDTCLPLTENPSPCAQAPGMAPPWN